mgnify:CR=1 FL=1
MNTIIEQGHEAVSESAINAVSKVRVWRDDYAIGQGKDQGDLLLWVSDADVSKMERVQATGDFQLAPGTTQGSRHTVDARDVEIYKPAGFGQLVNVGTRKRPAGHILGYVLKVLRRTELKHPEHPWHELSCGIIQTAGQVDARTLNWMED